MPRLRPSQSAAQRGRRQVQNPLGAPRLPAPLPCLELQRSRQCPLVRPEEQSDEYRDAVFSNQQAITSLDVLRDFTDKFAKSKSISVPFAIDPQGKLAAEVKADYALGQRIGIEHTPTIWVVTANSKGAPFVEVVDRTKLYELIDQAVADTRSK